MERSKLFVSCFIYLIVALSMTGYSYAALNNNGDGTVTQTRNDGFQLMWLQDSHASATTGYCSIAGNCSNSTWGYMSWDQANAWIDHLNTSDYLGYNDWRLPDTSPINGTDFSVGSGYDGTYDEGHNMGAPGTLYEGSTASEMAYMFYTELGLLASHDTSGNQRSEYGLMDYSGLFEIGNNAYWSVEGEVDHVAWMFSFSSGSQVQWHKSLTPRSVWAVRDAGVVPEPISSILFLTGGTLLAARRFVKIRNTA